TGDAGGGTYLWNAAALAAASPAEQGCQGNPAALQPAALPVPDGQKVTAVAFSPDGRDIATGDADGNTYVWNAASHQVARTLTDQAARASRPWRSARTAPSSRPATATGRRTCGTPRPATRSTSSPTPVARTTRAARKARASARWRSARTARSERWLSGTPTAAPTYGRWPGSATETWRASPPSGP